MAHTLHVVRTDDFLRFRTDGSPDLEESITLLKHLAQECIDLGLTRVLLDLRARPEDSTLRISDIYTLARTFHEIGFGKHHRLAVLHRHRAGERAELFAMLAKLDGWTVETFDNYEDAIEWFGEAYRIE
jgi:hypothetical protein